MILALTSCHGTKDIDKRRYTAGHYSEFSLDRFSLGKDKTSPESERIVEQDTLSDATQTPVSDSIIGKTMNAYQFVVTRSSEMYCEQGVSPLINHVRDSAVARISRKDSLNVFTDSLPESVALALSSQAMVSLATLGALATLAEPEMIWFSFLPIILSPFFLVVSLIAAAVVQTKIQKGQIDKRYKRYMRLWAVMLMLNMLIAIIIITTQTWF